jgi:hypothetical protein
MKNLSKIAFYNAHTRQAVVNWCYLPRANRLRLKGISFKSSEFNAPLLESLQDIEDLRMKEFQGQYKSKEDSVYVWDQLDKRSVDRKAEAVLQFDVDEGEWVTLVYNKEDDANKVFRSIDPWNPTFLIKCLESLHQNVSAGMDIEFKAGEEGGNYPEDHIMNLLWRLEGRGKTGKQAEMISREAHCLIHGSDLSPNLNSNQSNRTFWKPNYYHHFYW